MLIWYLARAAGLSAYVALTVSTAAGAISSHRRLEVGRRTVLQYVHRAAAATGLALLVLHVATLLADSYADVGVRGLLPFGSGYRPFAVTLGVLSLYLLVAVALSGVLRSRLVDSDRATRTWRSVHALAYLSWGLSAWHFLVVGTDSGQWWARLVLATGVVTVAGALAYRLTDRGGIRRRVIAPAPVPVRAGRSRGVRR